MMPQAAIDNIEMNFVLQKTGQMCPLNNIEHLWMIVNEVYTNKDSFHMYFKYCKCLENFVMYS